MDDVVERLARQLQHDTTRNLLTQAGLFLLAHELVKSAVVDDVKRFLSWEVDSDFQGIASEEYQAEVLDHGDKRPFVGSVDWLVKAGALTEEHRLVIDRLQAERHRVAHEVLGLIVDPNFDLDLQTLVGAADVLKRIGSFFGQLNIASDPAFDNVEVDPETIESGTSVVYSYVLAAVEDILVRGRPST